jgi:hypothetical protein
VSRAGSIVAGLLLLLAPGALAKPAPPPDLVVVGRVSLTTRPSPHCGTGAFAIRVRFQVEEVVAGKYEQPFVDVVIGCPEMFPVRFEVGARARLTLAREQPRPKTSWAYTGELPAPRFPQFWLRKAEPPDAPAPAR